MARQGLSRREFVTGAGGALAAAALGEGCVPGGENPYGGVYAGRFTYRIGEPISVLAALQTPSEVILELLRHDTPGTQTLLQQPVQVGKRGNSYRPGVRGAGFGRVAQLATGALDPGLYSVRIPKEALQPENQQNTYHNFPSSNWLARFVVTAAYPGSHSRLLWVHDSLTGVCYGSFGGESIYGGNGVKTRSVSWSRPGLDRGTANWQALRFLRENGYEFEYTDLIALANAPPGALDEYDLVMMAGQFEYIPHAVLAHLDDHLAGGGNLLVASNEWATFRVRLETSGPRLTTYKSEFKEKDPFYGTGNPANDDLVAGVGMVMDGSFWETEIIGQTIWGGYAFPPQDWIDLSLHNVSEAGWILAGTGLGAGDVLPGAFNGFGTGTLIDFDVQGEPFPVDLHLSGTPADTLVWAVAPSDDARAWWLASDGEYWTWPSFAGHATATWQQRSSGAEVVTLPSHHLVKSHIGDPIYERVLLNIVERLSQPT